MKTHTLTLAEWNSFVTMECSYGELKIEQETFLVNINGGLIVLDKKIEEFFNKENAKFRYDIGYMFGNCQLVFKDYLEIKIQVSPYIEDQNGKAVWFDTKTMKYTGIYKGETNNYGMEGGLNYPSYCPAWIDIECDARCVELHILDPA